MQKVFENQKMAVEVDGVDTVFVTNKVTQAMTSVQVNDDDGFTVVYSEEDQALASVSVSGGGEIEILADVSIPSDSEELSEEVD